MLTRALLLGASVFSLATAVQAADLVVDVPPADIEMPAADHSIYVQVLGGAAFESRLDYYEGDDVVGFDDFELGYALAGAIGVVVMDGVSLEGDVLYTHRLDVLNENYSLSTLSAMANVKYTAHLNDMFSLYAAGGLGVIHYTTLEDLSDSEFNYTGFGYQLIGGASAAVTENVSVIGEFRYQDTFDIAADETDDYYGVTAPTATLLVGLKVGF